VMLAPAGLRADQIGIVVDDLEQAMHRFGRVFACGEWHVYTYGPEVLREAGFRGRPGRFEMRLALAGAGPQIELIQPLRGPSLYHEWMEEHGEGLHHVGMRVPDLLAAIRDMEQRGFEVLQSGTGYGLDGDGGFAYLDTAGELGVTLELIEVPAHRREPDAIVHT
jgi:methylmalonyl-CoA/ethylmalonyl-CoA epimerase